MRVAVLSDIHGNLPALELVLKEIGRVDLLVSLGDVVNYGPWSNECVEKLEGIKNCIKIMGNHDLYFLNSCYDGGNANIKKFYETLIKGFHHKRYLKSYKSDTTIGKYNFRHTIKDLCIYPDTNIVLDNNYVIGHSHYQFVIKNSGFTLLNPGSIGQNRKFINEINYLIFDLQSGKYQMKSFIYDIEPVLSEMRKQRYPEECIRYYLNKPRRTVSQV